MDCVLEPDEERGEFRECGDRIDGAGACKQLDGEEALIEGRCVCPVIGVGGC